MDDFNVEKFFEEISKDLNLSDEKNEVKDYKNEIIKFEEYLNYLEDKMDYYKFNNQFREVVKHQLNNIGWENRKIQFECRCKSNIAIKCFEKMERKVFKKSHGHFLFDQEYNTWVNAIYCPNCGDKISFQTYGESKIYKIESKIMGGD
jgi:hypothetical protein